MNFSLKEMLPSYSNYNIKKRPNTPRNSTFRQSNMVPHQPYPKGWFYLCMSKDVKKGKTLGLQRFGKDLVVFRTESGKLNVIDGHCPHLGAYLADGKIIGEEIECPFHAWRFDGNSGKCVGRKGSCAKPLKVDLVKWHIDEQAGFVHIWNDPDGQTPAWECHDIPELLLPNWSKPNTREHVVYNHVQDIAENAADVSHLFTLHNLWTEMPDNDHREMAINDLTMVLSAQEENGILPGVRGWSKIEITFCGMQNVQARIEVSSEKGAEPYYRNLAMALITPIDENSCNFASHIMIQTKPWMRFGLDRLLVRIIARMMQGEITTDTMIWDQKIYLDRPLLNSEDGPIRQFRKWSGGFYGEEHTAVANKKAANKSAELEPVAS